MYFGKFIAVAGLAVSTAEAAPRGNSFREWYARNVGVSPSHIEREALQHKERLAESALHALHSRMHNATTNSTEPIKPVGQQSNDRHVELGSAPGFDSPEEPAFSDCPAGTTLVSTTTIDVTVYVTPESTSMGPTGPHPFNTNTHDTVVYVSSNHSTTVTSTPGESTSTFLIPGDGTTTTSDPLKTGSMATTSGTPPKPTTVSEPIPPFPIPSGNSSRSLSVSTGTGTIPTVPYLSTGLTSTPTPGETGITLSTSSEVSSSTGTTPVSGTPSTTSGVTPEPSVPGEGTSTASVSISSVTPSGSHGLSSSTGTPSTIVIPPASTGLTSTTNTIPPGNTTASTTSLTSTGPPNLTSTTGTPSLPVTSSLSESTILTLTSEPPASSSTPCSTDSVSSTTRVDESSTTSTPYQTTGSSRTSSRPPKPTTTSPCDEDDTTTTPSSRPSTTHLTTATTATTTLDPCIDTTMTPATTAALTKTPVSPPHPTKTICEHDEETTGPPEKEAVYCGVKGKPAGVYFIAEFIEERSGVPVTEEGCYQFCDSVMESTEGCQSYRFYHNNAGAPRCALYGMPVSWSIDELDAEQDDTWYDLACGSPTVETWHMD